jgi:hypothetical protein
MIIAGIEIATSLLLFLYYVSQFCPLILEWMINDKNPVKIMEMKNE